MVQCTNPNKKGVAYGLKPIYSIQLGELFID